MHRFNFELCRSDVGDGGWSLHPPGSEDDSGLDILASGPAEWDEARGDWIRPNATDYRSAFYAYCAEAPKEHAWSIDTLDGWYGPFDTEADARLWARDNLKPHGWWYVRPATSDESPT